MPRRQESSVGWISSKKGRDEPPSLLVVRGAGAGLERPCRSLLGDSKGAFLARARMPPLPVQRLWRCCPLPPAGDKTKKETSFEASFYFRVFRGVVSTSRRRWQRPWPPPMHRVARPCLASSRLSISCSRVTMIRAPEAPTGWPREMAPPLTLTLLMSKLQLTGNSDGLGRKGLVGLDRGRYRRWSGRPSSWPDGRRARGRRP